MSAPPPRQQRRPPPLPKSIFSAIAATGADGSARPPTSLDPARLHPASVVNATANASSDIVLLSSKRGSTSTGADDLAAQLDATSVKTDTKLVKLKVDVDLTHEQGWDQLEDAVRDLVDVGETGKSSRPIVLYGILAPDSTPVVHSTKLLSTPEYAKLFQPHVASLSLYQDVYLVIAPPSSWARLLDGQEKDEAATRDELKAVMRIYLAHAMECFGSRLVYSSGARGSIWYEIVRSCIADLLANESSDAQESMDAIFGGNASKLELTK